MFLSVKVAEAFTPATLAVTVYEPTVVPATRTGLVATPD